MTFKRIIYLYTYFCLSVCKKISLSICFLELSEEFVGTQKQFQISHGKQAIGVQAIEVGLAINIDRYSGSVGRASAL